MNDKRLQGIAHSPFDKNRGDEIVRRCTPDNPFGIEQRSTPQLRSLEGRLLSYDPIASQKEALMKIQNLPIAAIGFAVTYSVGVTMKSVQAFALGSLAYKFTSDMFKVTEGIIEDMPRKRSDEPFNLKQPDIQKRGPYQSDGSDRMRSYQGRQEERNSGHAGGEAGEVVEVAD